MKTVVSTKTGSKLVYIEYIRMLATIAVVFLHVVVTLNSNHSMDELGVFNYSLFSACHMLVKWAVPCFVMVSGALLLNPAKSITFAKISNYIGRMFCVLLTFGFVYSLLELVFTERKVSWSLLFKAILNTAEGHSWSHIWYVYMLISLYLITLPFRFVIEKLQRKELRLALCVLIVGNFVIPSINSALCIELQNYMILNQYATYYLLGYYLSTCERKNVGLPAVSAISITAVSVAAELYSLNHYGTSFAVNHSEGNVFELIQSVSCFMLVRGICELRGQRQGSMCQIVGEYSFGIYLIHPFFINLIYKVIGFTPLSIPVGLGILVLFMVIFALSLAGAAVLKKAPLIGKIM